MNENIEIHGFKINQVIECEGIRRDIVFTEKMIVVGITIDANSVKLSVEQVKYDHEKTGHDGSKARWNDSGKNHISHTLSNFESQGWKEFAINKSTPVKIF